MRCSMLITLALPTVFLIAGCSEGPQPVRQAASSSEAASSEYLLPAEPEDAKGVADFRKAAADDQEAVVVGRIGGDASPWVDGAAAFLITDTSLRPCSEREGDNCATPWDYCCDLDVLKDSKVMVKVVDSEGNLVRTDARQLLNVKELDTVVVRGRTHKDDAGNVTILADGVFVRS